MILIDDQIQEYTPEEIARWTDELPEWRRKQVLAYKNDMGRRQSLLAYRLLCQGLREEYGIMEQPTFVYNEHGKPYIIIKNEKFLNESSVTSAERKIKNVEGPHFSLSHCKEGVCCAISDKPVGIDIESANRKISDSVIRYSMNEGEQALIRESDDPQRTFLRLWTQKEAVLKRLGTGIRDDMRDILSDYAYTIEVRENERYILSVAW